MMLFYILPPSILNRINDLSGHGPDTGQLNNPAEEYKPHLFRFLFTTLLPGLVLCTMVYFTGAANMQQQQHLFRHSSSSSPSPSNTATIQEMSSPPPSSSKLIQNSLEILVSTTSTYLTLMVLVECTVRIVLLKFGLDLGAGIDDPGGNQALEKCIERSLVVVPQTNETASGSCCAICLEEFKPEDTVVSGRNGCCKSGTFHKSCIHQWLRINDSCPCCRQPMLVLEEPDADEREIAHEIEHESHQAPRGYLGYFRSQFRMRINTATRLRNEILSYYINQRG